MGVAFLLSCVLLILFASYVLQVRNKPYMSQVEREDVKANHRHKTHQAELVMDETGMTEMPKDLRIHYEMDKALKLLQSDIDRRKRKISAKVVTSLASAAEKLNNKPNHTIADYYFDYNTVEQVLLMCSIFLSLVAIMFESGQFYVLDPATGALALSSDPTNVTFYTVVLVMGAISLIGSLVYCSTVLMSEMLGCVPKWLRVPCAHKLSATNKRNMADRDQERNSFDDGVFEMAPIESTVFSNPLQELEEAKKKHEEVE